jgi:hypothetical protein
VQVMHNLILFDLIWFTICIDRVKSVNYPLTQHLLLVEIHRMVEHLLPICH